MRIIAGRFRRRILEARPGVVTRPISDFVKETLFEHIQHLLPGKRIADIFAGTGTIGLEALSRGAVSVVFIEQDARAYDLLKKNIANLKVESETFCWRTDVFRCSFRPRNVEQHLPCDVVFLDPPYKLVETFAPGSPLFKAVQRIARPEFTAPDALLLLRTPENAEFQLPGCWQPWEPLPRLQFASMDVYLYEKVASLEADHDSAEQDADTADSAIEEMTSESDPGNHPSE